MNTQINQDANVVANLQKRDIYNRYQKKKTSIQETDLQASLFRRKRPTNDPKKKEKTLFNN